MNFLKTSETGGHPLTLNDLGWIQGSVLQGLQYLVNSIVGNKPCILYGIEVIGPYNIGGSNFQSEITEGVYWDGNELLFHEYNYEISTSTNTPIHIWKLNRLEQTLSPNVTYKNGQSKGVYKRGVCKSELNGTIGADVSTIVRLDDELKSRLGINDIRSQLTALQNLVNNIVNNINTIWITLNKAVNDISDHINTGFHNWDQINAKPYSYGSAYLGDIGITSPAFPHTMGTNCRRVAGTSVDSLYEIKLPNNATISNYRVDGIMVGTKSGWGPGNYQGVLWNDCNDIAWCIVKKDSEKFHIAVRDLGGVSQDLWFEFTIIDMSKV